MLDTVQRPNIYSETLGPEQFGIIQKPLTLVEKIYNQTWIRKIFILVMLAGAWEIYGRWLDNPLLVPPFSAAVQALIADVADGTIPTRALSSIQVLLVGFATGTTLAGLLTVFAISTRIGTDFLETMTAMFNPLPAIALLPLALIWFGLGAGSLVFVLVHSVMWAVALNTLAGFRGVSTTVRMVGRNYNLKGLRFVGRILIPAAFPSILAGLKIGARRARLVHLREQKSAQHSGSVRRVADDHHNRPCGRERGVPLHRNQNSATLGHAILIA
jgi:NitT/TauT family transport system permease protein